MATARQVSRVLKAAGIPTGYRYTQSGYRNRDGSLVTEAGVEVSRMIDTRYSGRVDAGCVNVYLIAGALLGGHAESYESLAARVRAALEDAGYKVGGNRSVVFIPDDED